MIGIILWIVNVGMVLQMHSGKHRKGEPEDQGAAMAQDRINNAVAVGRIMGGVMDNRAGQM
jgi:hypothetical protein